MFCKCDLKYATKSVTVEECKQDEYCAKVDKCRQRYMKVRFCLHPRSLAAFGTVIKQITMYV